VVYTTIPGDESPTNDGASFSGAGNAENYLDGARIVLQAEESELSHNPSRNNAASN
jgi:hypothetical protein